MASTSVPKTIFMTGATGYLGSVITEFAIADGLVVRGLSRSEAGDSKLKRLGATPVRGDLNSLEVLRSESAGADVVIHLADSFGDHFDLTKYEEVIKIDAAVVDAFADSLSGTNKPLLVTSGTLVVAANPDGTETDEKSPLYPNPIIERNRSEQYALSLANKGVRVTAIRLAPFVYGRGGSGVRMFMSMALSQKQATYVGDGHWRTSSVHVDDAARLYLLAATMGAAPGEIFNATNNDYVSIRELTEAIAATLNVQAVSIPEEEAEEKIGAIMTYFLKSENQASSTKANKAFNWKPREPSLLQELATGSYHSLGQEMLKSS